MFKPVGSLIREIPTRARTPAAVIALQIRQVAKESLKVVCAGLPTEIIESIRPSSFLGGVLTMSVTSPLIAAELQMRSGGLIEEINKTLGKKIVTKLRFRLR